MRFLPCTLILLAAMQTDAIGDRPILLIEGQSAQVTIDLGGGSISDFRLGANGLNPLQWDSLPAGASEEASLAPRPMGHFLCLDRWGPATEAEQAEGMGWHGEAARVAWDLDKQPSKRGHWVGAEMSATLPLAGLSVSRSIQLHRTEAVFVVSEAVSNDRHLGRIYNIVQHPTIGPPFLDETLVVDSNGTRGFMQERPMPNPEVPEVAWPKALNMDGAEVDMRRLTDDDGPAVVSYLVDDEYGWATAANPGKGLLLGYLWKASEYPWIDMWRNVRDGKPHARGLEFGTTGLHQPGPVLVEKGKIFGEKLFRFIDANETQRFSYACFLAEIPEDFDGVTSVDYDGETIAIEESGSKRRKVTIAAGSLFD